MIDCIVECACALESDRVCLVLSWLGVSFGIWDGWVLGYDHIVEETQIHIRTTVLGMDGWMDGGRSGFVLDG